MVVVLALSFCCFAVVALVFVLVIALVLVLALAVVAAVVRAFCFACLFL